MAARVSVIEKMMQLVLIPMEHLTNFLQRIRADFHLKILIQHITPVQDLTLMDFGVQHQLMLTWNGKPGVSVMTCVHLKVCIYVSKYFQTC